MLWIAYPLLFLATVFSSLFKPAMNSVLPALAGEEENLLRANNIWIQMDSVSFVLGPALGAYSSSSARRSSRFLSTA